MKTKICSICKIEKSLQHFSKHLTSKFGVRPDCKECCKKYKKKFYKDNRKRLLKEKSDYYKNNKDKEKQRLKQYRDKNPWITTYNNAKQRCENLNHPDYKYYGLRGIKCLITVDEIKEIWFRDKAYNLIDPTIDRKDNNGNYELSNCRFIENIENSVKDKRKPILQYDLNGNFIREWNSIKEASIYLHVTHISDVLNNYRKSCGGYKWKYKENVK